MTAATELETAALADLLHDRYRLTLRDTQVLGGEHDRNLLAEVDTRTPGGRTDGHRRFIVKISPPTTSLAQLHWQHDLLAALRNADVPPVPEVRAAIDGADITRLHLDGGDRLVRVYSWLPGSTVSELRHHSRDLLLEWGAAGGRLVAALADECVPEGLSTSHHWDGLRADEAVDSQVRAVTDADRRDVVARIMRWYERDVAPVRDRLPRQVLHQDLNDFNVLATRDADGRHRLGGVLDFADALVTARVNELAVAMAYAMLRKDEPVHAAMAVAEGFLSRVPLTDAELAVAYPIAAARLCVNATTWTAREAVNGDYARARMRHTWPTLARIAQIPPALVLAHLRALGGATARSLPAGVTGATTVRGRHLTPVEAAAATGDTSTGAVRPRRRTVGCPPTLRLGVDVMGPVHLTVPGTVETGAPPDTVVLRHDDPAGPFWTRWAPAPAGLSEGAPAPAGTVLAADGSALRVAAFTDLHTARSAPDVVTAADRAAWQLLSPDPGPLLGTPPQPAPPPPRSAHVASSQRAYYRHPPRLAASHDVWLHDADGLAYLDTMNNVTHVGHANERVVAALAGQAARLNTNSRFVYDGIERFAARLAGLLPDPLDVVYLVCTGSEANDLALRIARQVTAREDVVVIDGAYHGNTAAVTGVSPDRYKGPGGRGAPPTTHELPQPDRYRGRYGYDDPAAGARYARDAAAVFDHLDATGRPPAALIAESLMGTAGTIVHPDGYLAAVSERVRASGGLYIADEVQVGFGRLGTHFWGFQTHGVVPDIVTMGKPIGNGHPMAAVVTTRAVADAFDTGMKYFNTFGGNPVSCAVGEAVLDEIESRGLQEHALTVGAHLLERLTSLAARHPVIGDVRGRGLYAGVELVRDPATRTPAPGLTRHVTERLMEEGVLTYPTGPRANVLKIKPPMTFTAEHADLFVDTLDEVLSEGW